METNNANLWYGGYNNCYNEQHNYNVGRTVSTHPRLFGRGPSDANCPGPGSATYANGIPPHQGNVNEGMEAYGSMHTGVVNFLCGDGSVHAVSITTTPEIMWRLANVSDGEVVSLPQ